MRRLLMGVACGLTLLATPAFAEAPQQRVNVGGYVRMAARPDFQGGFGSLGYWNLYGRLLNEGPWAGLELRIRLLDREPGTTDPWTNVHFRVEGGALSGAEASNGSLGSFRLAQAFVEAGNVLIPNVTWRLGTLWSWMGDLGLYDMQVAQLFFGTLGLSGTWSGGPIEFTLGLGDSGFMQRGLQYSPLLTGGGQVRIRAPQYVEVGLGGQVMWEPRVTGNRFAPHDTPGIDYEDWIRGEVIESFVDRNPGRADFLDDPVPTANLSGRAIGYVGFGGFGPIKWNSFYARFELTHPQNFSEESFGGDDYTLYISSLTDERFALTLGDELQMGLVPDRWDLNLGVLYGNHFDRDNSIAPSDHDRWYLSGILRTQVYLTRTFHVLVETSIAREHSRNGNAFRNHGDSIFASSGGRSDSRGLEYGDSDTRDTWQGKAGVVINPLGPGIYTRPSIRVMYGVQHSSQNQAYGNSFIETLSQLNQFGAYESHWHHVLALEAEAWF